MWYEPPELLAPVLVTPPSGDIVTVAEMRTQSRVDAPDADELQWFIDGAVSHIDGYRGILGYALLTQEWRQDFAHFYQTDPLLLSGTPRARRPKLRLPLGPLLSVSMIEYFDVNNVLQTLSSSVYDALSDRIGPYVTLNYNQSWPNIYTRDDAVRVTWTCGYGDTADAVPAAIRHAIRMIVAHWYNNRETVVVDNRIASVEIPFGADALLAGFRRVAM